MSGVDRRYRGGHARRNRRLRSWLLGAAVAVTLVVATVVVLGRPTDPTATTTVSRTADRSSVAAATPTPSATPTPTPTPTPRPDPTSVPVEGDGTVATSSGSGPRVGDSGRLVQYRVEVERGLGLDLGRFVRAVDATLADDRGWTADGQYSFQRTDEASLRVVLASPAMTDRLCAPLLTRGEVSCRNGDDVVINAKRWTEGVPYYDDLGAYRQYVVNHEVGHALGFGHVPCPAAGEPAPIMLQQTLGLDGCTANPWP